MATMVAMIQTELALLPLGIFYCRRCVCGGGQNRGFAKKQILQW